MLERYLTLVKNFTRCISVLLLPFAHCSLKKPTEEHFNRSKAFLLHFMMHMTSISRKKSLAEVWLIHEEQMSLKNFIIS